MARSPASAEGPGECYANRMSAGRARAEVRQVSRGSRAAAWPAGSAWTARTMTRGSRPAKRTAPGARRSKVPGLGTLTKGGAVPTPRPAGQRTRLAGPPRSPRVTARATAAPAHDHPAIRPGTRSGHRSDDLSPRAAVGLRPAGAGKGQEAAVARSPEDPAADRATTPALYERPITPFGGPDRTYNQDFIDWLRVTAWRWLRLARTDIAAEFGVGLDRYHRVLFAPVQAAQPARKPNRCATERLPVNSTPRA
jgi:hypothetical protein